MLSSTQSHREHSWTGHGLETWRTNTDDVSRWSVGLYESFVTNLKYMTLPESGYIKPRYPSSRTLHQECGGIYCGLCWISKMNLLNIITENYRIPLGDGDGRLPKFY
jgi:hypothetical protein